MLRRVRALRVLGQHHYNDTLTLSRPFLSNNIVRQNRRASSRAAPIIPPPSPPVQNDALLLKGKGKEKTDKDFALETAAKSFQEAGLNARLSLQLVSAFPSIRTPTPAQKALLSTISKDNDIILRALTGTGKSFGLLLGLLNKPRLVVRETEEDSKREKRITSIIVVPSRELAMQYEGWAKQLFPKNMHHTLSSAVTVKYRDKSVTIEEHLKQLSKNQPHVLVITPTLLQDLLNAPKGSFILGISTLRTLVYDEGDALLDLPSRYPSQKLIWNHLQHPSDGLLAINTFMKTRATFSGGVKLPSAGFETDQRGPNEDIRRKAHQGNDLLIERKREGKKQKFILSEPKPLVRNERALQLIMVSATANSVMRNFLGAKTGWLRTGVRVETGKEGGKWLDLTGLSQGVKKAKEVEGLETKTTSGWAAQVPKELRHSCVVVDEPIGESIVENWRILKPSQVRLGRLEEYEEELVKVPKWGQIKSSKPVVRSGPLIVAPTNSSQSSLDEHLLTCLAYLFASQPVQRALALVPATWSLVKTREYLARLDVPVRFLNEGERKPEEDENGGVLYVIQANVVRGIDVPGGLSHVFCVGIESVRDATGYTHMAGRAARIGHDEEGSHQRPVGHVITLVRGLATEQARQNYESGKITMMASSELKMSLIYKRLNLRMDRLQGLRYDQLQDEEEPLPEQLTLQSDVVDFSESQSQSEVVEMEMEEEQVSLNEENGPGDIETSVSDTSVDADTASAEGVSMKGARKVKEVSLEREKEEDIEEEEATEEEAKEEEGKEEEAKEEEAIEEGEEEGTPKIVANRTPTN